MVFDPRGGDAFEVGIDAAGDDAVVSLVGVESAGITGSQQQRGGGFAAGFR
jgi:hypothetical protein